MGEDICCRSTHIPNHVNSYSCKAREWIFCSLVNSRSNMKVRDQENELTSHSKGNLLQSQQRDRAERHKTDKKEHDQTCKFKTVPSLSICLSTDFKSYILFLYYLSYLLIGIISFCSFFTFTSCVIPAN